MRAACWLLALAFAACGDPTATPPAAAEWPPFTVRGRLDAPLRLTWHFETDRAPIAADRGERAIARAIAAWQQEGVVAFAAAAPGTAADVTLGFRRGHHGACEPFGPSTAIAHTGPTAHGTFVHFDAARPWDEDRLFRTALHELGHALGLGHSPCADAVMSNGIVVPDRIGPADRDGLHTLYGGGQDGPCDLRIRDADGGTVLSGLAPPGTERAAFDVDGDGRDELLLWRGDGPNRGAMLVCRFGDGPQLLATVGPFLGIASTGTTLAFARTEAGDRLLLATRPNGRTTALRFDAAGVPQPCEPIADLDALVARARTDAAAHTVDLDGDGKADTID